MATAACASWRRRGRRVGWPRRGVSAAGCSRTSQRRETMTIAAIARIAYRNELPCRIGGLSLPHVIQSEASEPAETGPSPRPEAGSMQLDARPARRVSGPRTPSTPRARPARRPGRTSRAAARTSGRSCRCRLRTTSRPAGRRRQHDQRAVSRCQMSMAPTVASASPRGVPAISASSTPPRTCAPSVDLHQRHGDQRHRCPCQRAAPARSAHGRATACRRRPKNA